MEIAMRFKPLVAIALFLSLSFVAYAHPGRTDSDGGHTDHSTGEYHYHHGYPAHQHYDIDGDGDLDCPYKTAVITKPKDEPTYSNDIADYLDDHEADPTEAPTEAPTELQKEEENSSKNIKVPMWIIGLVGYGAFFGLILVVQFIKDEIKRNKRK
jgi:hypothetical protein